MSLPLLALFLAAFAIGTTEFVITGILPNVAGDLGVSIPTAGYLISGYALGVAIGGPIMAIVTAGLERKLTLLGLMGIFVVGNLLCAAAPSYGWLMAARVIVSLSHGSSLGIASVIAAGMVAPERRARAVGLVISGITAANVIGVPLGTAIGNAVNWRATFVVVSLLGIVAGAAAALWVPKAGGEGEKERAIVAEIKVLGRQDVYMSFLIIVVAATGFFAMFAYITPFIVEVVGLPANWLPLMLAGLGLAAFAANFAGGRLADWNLMGSVIGIFAVVVVVDLGLLGAASYLVAGIVLLALWQFTNFSFAVPMQARILAAAHSAPNLAATLVSTAFNIGISGGAAIGSVFLTRGFGYAHLPAIGIVTSLVALALTAFSRSLDRRAPVAAKAAAG